MQVLNVTMLFLGWVFPYISLTYGVHIGEDSSILGTEQISFPEKKNRFPSVKLRVREISWKFKMSTHPIHAWQIYRHLP